MQRKIITIAGSVLLALGGVSAIVFSREYFARLILGAASRAVTPRAKEPTYKHVYVYYPSDGELLSVSQQVDMHQDLPVLVSGLVRVWLALLSSERVLTEAPLLQAASILQPGSIALLSFDRGLFSKDWSTRQKVLCVQSLFKTLQGIQVSAVQLLCNHELVRDTHIDFSSPLPIDGFA